MQFPGSVWGLIATVMAQGTRPRNTQVSLADTPYYHGNARCVRRAFLCGIDHLTGENYEHRRGGIVDKLKFLSAIFSIDIMRLCGDEIFFRVWSRERKNPLTPFRKSSVSGGMPGGKEC